MPDISTGQTTPPYSHHAQPDKETNHEHHNP
ncbi:Uncharacterised protein [Acinetobacter baumannii]|nr:Uncharacterised protein [Acinetobacter baumannii]